jgi:hypothetical protein
MSKSEVTSRRRILGDFLTEKELAIEIGRSVRHIKRWRTQGLGPPFCRIGRTPVYRVEAVRDWIRSHEKQMPREAVRGKQ